MPRRNPYPFPKPIQYGMYTLAAVIYVLVVLNAVSLASSIWSGDLEPRVSPRYGQRVGPVGQLLFYLFVIVLAPVGTVVRRLTK